MATYFIMMYTYKKTFSNNNKIIFQFRERHSNQAIFCLQNSLHWTNNSTRIREINYVLSSPPVPCRVSPPPDVVKPFEILGTFNFEAFELLEKNEKL